MKKIILITLLTFLLAISSKSQNYVPFPTENANWNVYYRGTCEEKLPDTVLIRYAIHGDTTINNLLYLKLCIESGDLNNPVIKGLGGIRENGKKIYYKGETILKPGDDEEFLLYDFTVGVGDTIKHDLRGGFYSVVLEIDSIFIDGTYRKRYKVNNHWFYHNPDFIIEGIGSVNNGLLGHISDIPTCGTHYWEHICFSENRIVKFLNPAFKECFPAELISGIYEMELKTNFEIFPNPFNNQIFVKTKGLNIDLLFRLFDIKGKMLIEKKINSENFCLDFDVSNGIYTAVLADRNGKIITSKKLVKE
jgi:hypothetical protein